MLSLETLIDLKADSQHPKDKQRLPVLREALRQLEEENEPTPGDEKNGGTGEAGNDEGGATDTNTGR